MHLFIYVIFLYEVAYVYIINKYYSGDAIAIYYQFFCNNWHSNYTNFMFSYLVPKNGSKLSVTLN